MGSGAARPGKLAGLEAFLAEDRATLRRTEWHRCFLATRRAVGHRFHPLPRDERAGRAAGLLCLARLTALGFVLEILVGEELLFSGRPDEFRAAIHAREDPVLELHRSHLARVDLLRFSAEFLPIALTGERLFGATLVTWLQVEGVLLDILDDVFLLHLPLEAPESALDRFALLNFHFSHENHTPFGWLEITALVEAATTKYARLSRQRRILG